MCGRAYETFTEDELEIRYGWEKLKKHPLGIKPNYNFSPTQMGPVVFIKDGKITIEMMRWGLIPFWAKSIQDASKYSLINAKGEEISEKKTYKHAFQKTRCIVPLSGFIEWKRAKGANNPKSPKTPFAIYKKDDPIMSIAGVYEKWESKDKDKGKDTGKDQTITSFSIITTRANSFMKNIHDRQPAVLAKEDELQWLDPKNQDIEKLQSFLEPCPSAWLDAFEISPLINSPKNNRPELLKPVRK